MGLPVCLGVLITNLLLLLALPVLAMAYSLQSSIQLLSSYAAYGLSRLPQQGLAHQGPVRD